MSCFISCIDVAGGIASVTAMVGFTPQIYKVYKTKSAKDISALMVLNFLVCSLAWIVYGILVDAPYLFVTNIVAGIIDSILLGQKFYYGKSKA